MAIQSKPASEAIPPSSTVLALFNDAYDPDPEKILCAGINYRSHAAETGLGTPVIGLQALDRLVGQSEALQAVKQRVAKVARGMAPVFVLVIGPVNLPSTMPVHASQG